MCWAEESFCERRDLLWAVESFCERRIFASGGVILPVGEIFRAEAQAEQRHIKYIDYIK